MHVGSRKIAGAIRRRVHTNINGQFIRRGESGYVSNLAEYGGRKGGAGARNGGEDGVKLLERSADALLQIISFFPQRLAIP